MSVVQILISFKEIITTYDLQILFIIMLSGEAQNLNDFLQANKAFAIFQLCSSGFSFRFAVMITNICMTMTNV